MTLPGRGGDLHCQKKTSKKQHGHSLGKKASPTYNSWKNMKSRCLNPNAYGYYRYGGRGIKVCDRWLDFRNFLADMGPRPEGTTIDRYPNNDGNYEPGNCRWATSHEQHLNQITLTFYNDYK